MNRQRLILFILVILFGVAAIWSYTSMPRLKTVSTPTVKPPQKAGRAVVVAADKAPRIVDDGTKLHMELLDSETDVFKGYRRNIFRPVFVDELKISKQKAMELKPPPLKIATIQPQAQPTIVQPEAAPLARFIFLGFLKKGAVRTIFLSNDNNVLLVKKGDKIAGRYQATEISDQALTLTVTDTGDQIVIPLVENRSLATAN